ncbi:hypothetical protein TEA_027184 [Camellia sinensis var. sinensis]|uniref:Inhibitor I9 domain-containing protein n=1 Tax=Camellia sinensis var. sinensis TaxID=542762 RepID=A0A4S4E7Q8_CAMSN|nr:hypothetical protein TEA_027184 [Camellia sinensis var. sinensis]
MSFSKLSPFLALFILFFLFFQAPAFAAKLSYIVYVGVHSHGLEDAEATVTKVKDSHCQFLASFLGSNEKVKETIFYSYSRDINGFAATLEDEEAVAIARNPNPCPIIHDSSVIPQPLFLLGFQITEKKKRKRARASGGARVGLKRWRWCESGRRRREE